MFRFNSEIFEVIESQPYDENGRIDVKASQFRKNMDQKLKQMISIEKHDLNDLN